MKWTKKRLLAYCLLFVDTNNTKEQVQEMVAAKTKVSSTAFDRAWRIAELLSHELEQIRSELLDDLHAEMRRRQALMGENIQG